METCRFLSKKRICQIGQLAQETLIHEDSMLAVLVGDVDKPSLADLTPTFVKNDGGRNVLFFVMPCTANDNVQTQQTCDSFVPKKQKCRDEWISNFSEG